MFICGFRVDQFFWEPPRRFSLTESENHRFPRELCCRFFLLTLDSEVSRRKGLVPLTCFRLYKAVKTGMTVQLDTANGQIEGLCFGILCVQRAQSRAKHSQWALQAMLPCFLLYTAVKIGINVQLDMANGQRVGCEVPHGIFESWQPDTKKPLLWRNRTKAQSPEKTRPDFHLI